MKTCLICNEVGLGLTRDIIDDTYYHDDCLINQVYLHEHNEVELFI